LLFSERKGWRFEPSERLAPWKKRKQAHTVKRMVESSKLYQLEIAFQNAHYSRVWQSHIYLIASVCYKEAVVFEEEMSQLRQVCCLRAAFKWASECWRAVWAS